MRIGVQPVGLRATCLHCCRLVAVRTDATLYPHHAIHAVKKAPGVDYQPGMDCRYLYRWKDHKPRYCRVCYRKRPGWMTSCPKRCADGK